MNLEYKPKLIYLKLNKKVKIDACVIKIGDIGKITCDDGLLKEQLQNIVLFSPSLTIHHYVISVLSVIEKIRICFPMTEVISVGTCTSFIEIKNEKTCRPILSFLKMFFVCAISFFGTAFTIMAFHNDIGITDLFHNLYQSVDGTTPSGLPILEISYSIGLAVGIIVFFNHFCLKKFSTDPTPVEVEMCSYEEEIQNALEASCEKEGNILDVD